MVMDLKNLLSFVLVISTCSACFDPGYMRYKMNLKQRVMKETLVIEETSLHIDGGLVFGVYMMPEDAQRMKAPTGAEFTMLLDERVRQKEQLIDHKICRHGYKMSSKPPFIGEYGIWTVDFYCNP